MITAPPRSSPPDVSHPLATAPQVVVPAKALPVTFAPQRKAQAPPQRKRTSRSLSAALRDLTDSDRDRLRAAQSRESSGLHLSPHDEFRPADWRWQLALRLAVERTAPQGPIRNLITSEEVRLAIEFILRGHEVWLDNRGFETAAIRACMLTLTQRESLRHAYECRVLARFTPEEVHQEMQLSLDVQAAYDRLFFDVRDRLDQRGAVFHALLKRPEDAPSPEEAIRRVERAYCYFCGKPAVEYFVDTRPSLPRPTTLEELMKFLETDALETLQRKAAIAMRLTDPANPKQAKQLIKLSLLMSTLKTRGTPSRRKLDMRPMVSGAQEAIAGLPPAARESFEAFRKERNHGLDQAPQ